MKNAEVVIATLNGHPGLWDSFMWGMCARRKWLLSVEFGKRTHKKKKFEKRRWEQLQIKLSPFKEDTSSDEEYEELNSWRTSYPSYHLDKKWCYYEDVKAEGSRRSLPTKQIKISIQLSFHVFVMHLFNVLCMIECLH